MGKLGVVVHACHLSTWEVNTGLEVSQSKKYVRRERHGWGDGTTKPRKKFSEAVKCDDKISV